MPSSAGTRFEASRTVSGLIEAAGWEAEDMES